MQWLPLNEILFNRETCGVVFVNSKDRVTNETFSGSPPMVISVELIDGDISSLSMAVCVSVQCYIIAKVVKISSSALSPAMLGQELS